MVVRGSALTTGTHPAPGPVQISGSGTIAGGGNTTLNTTYHDNNANEFSDYGLQ